MWRVASLRQHREQILVQLIPVRKEIERLPLRQIVAPEVADFAFHPALLVASTRDYKTPSRIDQCRKRNATK